MLYGTLTHRHPDYDPFGCWERLRLLNAGGYEIQEAAERFIPKAPNETETRYRYRLDCTAYVNYLNSVIGYLAGSLFGAPADVQPASDSDEDSTPGELPDQNFWTEFSHDCDLAGQPFTQLLHQLTCDALLYRRAVVIVDMPAAAETAENRAQEEAQGAGRAWCERLPVTQLTDWIEGKGDELTSAILHEVVPWRKSIGDPPGLIVERFTIWRMINGLAHWAVYETEPRDEKSGAPPSPGDEVAEAKPLTATSFARLPIRVLCLRSELWVGNKAGPLNEEHWRRRSGLDGALDRVLNSPAFIKRGPEVGPVNGALPSETQQNPTRGENWHMEAERRGFFALGAEDDIGFAEAPTAGLPIAVDEKREVVEEIYRTVHAMAQSMTNTSAVVGRSGESKREDRQATGVVLDALSARVRPFAIDVYETVSEGRGEDVQWTCHGLDSYDRDDRETVVAEAVDLQSLDLPSQTWRRAHAKQVAFATVPSLTPAEKAQVTREIDEGLGEDHMAREELQSQLRREQQERRKAGLAGGDQNAEEDQNDPGKK